MICFTEQQKREIVHTEMLVVEFKQLLIKNVEMLKEICVVVKDVLKGFIEKISTAVQMIHQKYESFPPKEKYKAVRRLDKCGFTEKEINLMVGGAYHCRNNC